MGDVAMSVPVLRAFVQQHPNIKLTILTREFFKPFFRDIPNVQVYVADLNGAHKGVFGLYSLAKALKKIKIDAVADLHNVLRTKILKLFLSGISVKQIDKGRTEKKALVSGKIFEPLKTTHQRYADVFESLGFSINLANPIFPEPKKLSDKASTLIGTDTRKWIGIAPFAQYESKMYPLDALEKLIAKLSKSYKILLFGGGDRERHILDVYQEKYEAVINLAGQFNLNEELNIISNLDLMLSMDSGNAHIAAMLGKKVITIWGVTHPYAGFSAFNQPENYHILANRTHYPLIPTSVYGNRFPIAYKEASRSILPESIEQKIANII